MAYNNRCFLIDCKLKDLSNLLTFPSAESQASYFRSKAKKSYTDMSYIRKEKVIRVNSVPESLYNCNYFMFQNTQYGNKWFYAFIDKFEFVHAHCTNIHIDIDSWQTYQFNLKFGSCFVEHEHVAVSDDVAGRHTLPENIPLGYYKNTLIHSDKSYAYPRFIIACKKGISDGEKMTPVTACGTTFGCGLFFRNTLSEAEDLIDDLEKIMSGNVLWVQSVPALSAKNLNTLIGGKVSDGGLIGSLDINASTNDSLNGYVPRNKKLLTYPYNYVTASSGSGDIMEYPIEQFELGVRFRIYGEFSQSPQLSCLPLNFCGETENLDKKTATEIYPQIPFRNDNSEYYNMAKSFNTVGFVTNYVGNSVGKAMDGGGISGGDIMNSLQSITNHYMSEAKLDDQSYRNSCTFNGKSTTGIKYASSNLGFFIYQRSISVEYAKIADDYLDYFGYKVMRNKVPNLKNRPNWNYVKTLNCNVYGEIPKPDLDKIVATFNNGVTLWHNPDTMYDYSQSNR